MISWFEYFRKTVKADEKNMERGVGMGSIEGRSERQTEDEI